MYEIELNGNLKFELLVSGNVIGTYDLIYQALDKIVIEERLTMPKAIYSESHQLAVIRSMGVEVFIDEY